MKSRKTGYLLAMFLLAGASTAWGFDVSVTAPQIQLQGALQGVGDIDVINQELRDLGQSFQTELKNDPDIARYSNQPLLAEGFANAGATAVHLGTQRSFIDYRRFAFVIGTGAAVSAPSADPSKAIEAAEGIEDDGDVYAGAAFQPISASFGLNLSRWVNGLRANAKIGYANISDGTIEDGVSFESISVGVGATYQLVQPRALPAGIIRWRGVSVGTGVNYQRNKTDLEFEANDAGFEATETLTFGDVGFTQAQLDASGTGLNDTDSFGTLLVEPTLVASIESRTFAIPLEVNTGVRFLYLLEFNVGAGVDLVFGESEVSVGSETDVLFQPSSQAAPYVSSSPGRANLGIKTTSDPQLLRPRVTAGLGANLGPVKLDIPLMYYFDSEGPGAMVGVNLGIVW